MQELIAYAIIGVAVLLAIRWLWLSTKKAHRGDAHCAGCALSDACKSKHEQHCDESKKV